MMDPPLLILDEVLHEILDSALSSLEEKISLQSELNSNAIILAHREDLEEILMNLILSAQDAMPEGGVLRVETQSVELDDLMNSNGTLGPGRYAVLEVSDSSNKIAGDLLDKIFEPVRRLNGAIAVESRVALGNKIQIHLPVEMAARPNLGNARGNDEIVLLVENQAAVRQLLARTLRESGYNVLEAADGSEALAILEREPDIRLLITDLSMPEMHGKRLASSAREKINQLPVLFMSGYPSKPTNLVNDAVGFLAKPFPLNNLLQEVQRLIPPGQ